MSNYEDWSPLEGCGCDGDREGLEEALKGGYEVVWGYGG